MAMPSSSLTVAFDLSTKLVASMSLLKGQFRAFWTPPILLGAVPPLPAAVRCVERIMMMPHTAAMLLEYAMTNNDGNDHPTRWWWWWRRLRWWWWWRRRLMASRDMNSWAWGTWQLLREKRMWMIYFLWCEGLGLLWRTDRHNHIHFFLGK